MSIKLQTGITYHIALSQNREYISVHLPTVTPVLGPGDVFVVVSLKGCQIHRHVLHVRHVLPSYSHSATMPLFGCISPSSSVLLAQNFPKWMIPRESIAPSVTCTCTGQHCRVQWHAPILLGCQPTKFDSCSFIGLDRIGWVAIIGIAVYHVGDLYVFN